jgi:hypothetical protein
MLGFLAHWWAWLGGGALAAIAAVAVLYLSGFKTVVETVDKALEPIFVAIGNMGGQVISDVWSEYRAGLRDISKTVAALFTLVVTMIVVAVCVYVPTKHVTAKQTEAHVWKQAHARFRLLPKPRNDSTIDVVRKSLGGLF